MSKKIILDCDPGHDDAVAIMLAAASDEIDLLGITCVAGNTTLKNTKMNALKAEIDERVDNKTSGKAKLKSGETLTDAEISALFGA